jgi:hypothetical protein
MISLLVSAVLAQSGSEQFLHQVALESDLKGPVDWASVVLEVTPGDRTAQAAFVTRRRAKKERGGIIRVSRIDQLLASDRVVPRHRKASWVIDFDQPAFAPAWDAAVAAVGERPTIDAVISFVAGYLTKKSYDRGFDLASSVAIRRGGDCTEHAVFLAALLRRFGIPARAVVGLVLIPTENEPVAFGHMWVEAFETRWRVADAAIPPQANPAYLPAGELAEEGPGYALSLMGQVTSLDFARLRLTAGPPR